MRRWLEKLRRRDRAQAVRQHVDCSRGRPALGANRGRIVTWILSYAMSWTAAGIALGAAGAFVAARHFRSMLYGVTPQDPWTFSLVLLLLAAVSALAAWVPARRAASLDPVATLRHE